MPLVNVQGSAGPVIREGGPPPLPNQWKPVYYDAIGARYFDAVVAGDEVGNVKPHPEPYETAARLLGVADPRRCVAIEDSPTGVASARAAGCVVLAVPSETPLADVDGVTVVDSLASVDLALLRKLVS